MPFINKIKDKFNRIRNSYFPKGCYYGVYLYYENPRCSVTRTNVAYNIPNVFVGVLNG